MKSARTLLALLLVACIAAESGSAAWISANSSIPLVHNRLFAGTAFAAVSQFFPHRGLNAASTISLNLEAGHVYRQAQPCGFLFAFRAVMMVSILSGVACLLPGPASAQVPMPIQTPPSANQMTTTDPLEIRQKEILLEQSLMLLQEVIPQGNVEFLTHVLAHARILASARHQEFLRYRSLDVMEQILKRGVIVMDPVSRRQLKYDLLRQADRFPPDRAAFKAMAVYRVVMTMPGSPTPVAWPVLPSAAIAPSLYDDVEHDFVTEMENALREAPPGVALAALPGMSAWWVHVWRVWQQPQNGGSVRLRALDVFGKFLARDILFPTDDLAAETIRGQLDPLMRSGVPELAVKAAAAQILVNQAEDRRKSAEAALIKQNLSLLGGAAPLARKAAVIFFVNLLERAHARMITPAYLGDLLKHRDLLMRMVLDASDPASSSLAAQIIREFPAPDIAVVLKALMTAEERREGPILDSHVVTMISQLQSGAQFSNALLQILIEFEGVWKTRQRGLAIVLTIMESHPDLPRFDARATRAWGAILTESAPVLESRVFFALIRIERFIDRSALLTPLQNAYAALGNVPPRNGAEEWTWRHTLLNDMIRRLQTLPSQQKKRAAGLEGLPRYRRSTVAAPLALRQSA